MGVRKEKTRNAGTMTENAFWSMIRSALRRRTMFWKPILKAKLLARRKYEGPNKRQKFEYQCNECKGWFKDSEIAVDHILPAGTLKAYPDLPGFVERLFCEVDGLQCLCNKCHDRKTNREREQ